MSNNYGDYSLFQDDSLQFSYALTSDNIYKALRTSCVYKKNFVKAIIETCLLGALVALFGVWWILWQDGNAMIFCIASALLIGLVWAVVMYSIRSTCNRLATGETITMTMYPDSIIVRTGCNPSWEIPLDGSIVCEEKDNVLILYTGRSEWTLLPLDSVPEGIRDAVRDRVMQKTTRLKK